MCYWTKREDVLGKFLQGYLAWEILRPEQSSWLLVGLLAPHIFFTKNIIYSGGGETGLSVTLYFYFSSPAPPPPPPGPIEWKLA